MVKESGKKRRRKTPMEGFNNVPEMLAEARRFVDAVTAAAEPSEATEPGNASLGMSPADESSTGPTSVASSGPSQPPQKRRTPRSPRAKPPAPQSQAAPPSDEADNTAAASTAPKADMQIPTRSPRAGGIEILHRVPGRTRMKIPMLKWNGPLAEALTARLTGVPGIAAATRARSSGSVR